MTEQANWLTLYEIEKHRDALHQGVILKGFNVLCNMAKHALEHPAPAQEVDGLLETLRQELERKTLELDIVVACNEELKEENKALRTQPSTKGDV